MTKKRLSKNKAPIAIYTVFRKKNTHSHFLSYLHE